MIQKIAKFSGRVYYYHVAQYCNIAPACLQRGAMVPVALNRLVSTPYWATTVVLFCCIFLEFFYFDKRGIK